MAESTLDIARIYVSAGFSVIPIMPNGSKRPVGDWKEFQKRKPKPSELITRFVDGVGIGIVTGAVSGGLEILDFDDKQSWHEFHALAVAEGMFPDCPVVETPRGFHLYLKHPPGAKIPGNTKLAAKAATPEEIEKKKQGKTTIETRGEGGQVLAPGCPPACHPTGLTYEWLMGPKLEDWANVKPVTADRYLAIMTLCRSLTEVSNLPALPSRDATTTPRGPGDIRPGDDFCLKCDWSDLLGRHGWTHIRDVGDVQFWKRPEKTTPGISATVGKVRRGMDGTAKLFIFSSNAAPFDQDHAYSAFEAFTVLNHSGDFEAAARDLGTQGYGGKSAPLATDVLKQMEAAGIEPTKKQRKAAEDASKKAIEADGSPELMDREARIREIRALTDLPIIGLVQSKPTGASYDLLLDSCDFPIPIGGVGNLRSVAMFESRIIEALQRQLPPGAKTRKGWPRLLTLLLSIVVVDDPSYREEARTLEWIQEYLGSGQCFFGHEWKEAVEGKKPFIREGRVHVHAEHFGVWLGYSQSVRLDHRDVLDCLRRLGLRREQKTASFTNRPQVGRSYWCGFLDILLPNYETSDETIEETEA